MSATGTISITRDNYHDWVLANENMAKAAGCQGLSLPVCFCEERRALRPQREGTNSAAGLWNMYGRVTRRSDQPVRLAAYLYAIAALDGPAR